MPTRPLAVAEQVGLRLLVGQKLLDELAVGREQTGHHGLRGVVLVRLAAVAQKHRPQVAVVDGRAGAGVEEQLLHAVREHGDRDSHLILGLDPLVGLMITGPAPEKRMKALNGSIHVSSSA